MKRSFYALLCAMLMCCALLFAVSCGEEECEHTWADATCTTAKTCTVCGVTEGAALGHAEEVIPAKAPTCTEYGYTEGKACTRCETLLVEPEILNPVAHTPVTIPAVAPTCTTAGTTAGTKCSACNTVLVNPETILATGHTEVEIPAVAPTCINAGATAGVKCSVCDVVITAPTEIPATGEHKEEVIPAQAPTCTTDGLTAGVKCPDCGEILIAQEVEYATGHTDDDWDDICDVCEAAICYHIDTTEVKTNVVEATCTTNGSYDLTITCNICNEIVWTEEGVVVPATGHVDEDGNGACDVCEAELTTYDKYWLNANKYGEAGFGAYAIDEDLPEGVVKAFQFTNRFGSEYVYVYLFADAEAATAYAEATEGAVVAEDVIVLVGTEAAISYVNGTDAPYIAPPCEHTNMTTENMPGVDATCTEDGYYYLITKCADCGFELGFELVDIPAAHVDEDADNTCDVCGEAIPDEPECEHVDEDGDLVCDLCEASLLPTACEGEHGEANEFGDCSECGYYIGESKYDAYLANANVLANMGCFVTVYDDEYLAEYMGLATAGFALQSRMYQKVIVIKFISAELAAIVAEQTPAEDLPGMTIVAVNEMIVITSDAEFLGYVDGSIVIPGTCDHANMTTENIAGADATCGAEGYYYIITKCADCGEEFGSERAVIPATGEHVDEDGDLVCDVCEATLEAPGCAHDFSEFVDEKAPTCTEAGNTWGIVCSYCGASDPEMPVEEIPALGHTEEAIPAQDATCTTAGATAGVKCSVCDVVITAPTEIPALGHTEEAIPAVDATCTADGATAGTKCSVCDEILTAPEVVPATGHVDDDTNYVCDVCEEALKNPDLCAHTYADTWTFGNNTHWKEATCGCNIKGFEAAHSWDETDETCMVCGYNVDEEGHEHEYEEGWHYDADMHWKETICGHKNDADYYEDHEYEDGKCVVCGATELAPYSPTDKYETYNWANTTIYVCLNENSNNQELSSELRRYLAGDTTENQYVDELVAERNAAALSTTNVEVKYTYWGEHDSDNANAGWGKSVTRMVETVMATSPTSPDIYCNQIYDMVSASLQKCFANIRTTKLSGGDNNFSFMEEGFVEYMNEYGEEWGYMMEYMTELGFSVKKQYLIASDYFIDLVRAFFVVPMNLNLLAEIDIDSSTGDRDEDEDFDVDDFYAMVMAGEWTYDTLIQYSEAIFSPVSGKVGGSMDDINGIIFTPSNGMISSALLYTTSIEIFSRTLNKETGFWECTYKASNEELYDFCDVLANLVSKTGVYVESVAHTDIRAKFVADSVLFGGIVLLGSLEYQTYQDMKSNGGFGILPVPVYRDGDEYLTIIHNMGRIAGIAANTTEFAQCSAYIDYQSTHSTDILNEYYEYKLQYDMAGGTLGNIRILNYIREHVRSAFDKTYEDAIGFNFKAIDADSSKDSWGGILSSNNFKVTTMRSLYQSNATKRKAYLQQIIDQYAELPE